MGQELGPLSHFGLIHYPSAAVLNHREAEEPVSIAVGAVVGLLSQSASTALGGPGFVAEEHLHGLGLGDLFGCCSIAGSPCLQ